MTVNTRAGFVHVNRRTQRMHSHLNESDDVAPSLGLFLREPIMPISLVPFPTSNFSQ